MMSIKDPFVFRVYTLVLTPQYRCQLGVVDAAGFSDRIDMARHCAGIVISEIDVEYFGESIETFFLCATEAIQLLVDIQEILLNDGTHHDIQNSWVFKCSGYGEISLHYIVNL